MNCHLKNWPMTFLTIIWRLVWALLIKSRKLYQEPVQFDEIDASRQLKKFENQKLSLSNGIELIVPNNVYQDAESVEFIQNDNGTYSILIKNIEDIQSNNV